ncbi:MAG: efflux RND transporter periplasmic adaptor subunit [Proteobacteria bacterium]|nr:efflux RND transporter periplasmic adaptor subunit [Pseudomonadota bacterium]
MKVPTWQAFSVVAVAALLGACGAEKRADTADTQPAAVRAVPVASVAVTAQTRAVGVLAPRDEIRLAFKVGGVVDSVRVESGDIVRKGQVLAELKRAEVDAAVSQAAEGVEKARRDLERARQLRIDEVATEEQVQDLTTAYNVARSNVDAARFNARFARIEAPVDGIVFERMAEGGELVPPGQPVIVLGSTASGWVVRVGLADRDAVRVESGAPAQVTFDAFPGRAFEGRVTRIGAAANRVTGTFEVEIEVQPQGARFARGLVAKVALPLSPLPDVASNATVVPVTALVDADGQRATVYVLDREKNVARRKDVTLGPLLGERVIVTAGLVTGEPVITDGAAWLTDGRSVRVVSDDGG